MPQIAFKIQFLLTLRSLGASEEHRVDLWNQLKKQYTQKGRHYHNMVHIFNMNLFTETIAVDSVEDMDLLRFSIFYHDYIYKAWKKDNEEKSAEFACQILYELNVDKTRIERCKNQIVSTKTHMVDANAPIDEKLLLDLDLEVLSWDWDKYEAYTQQIRKEYWMFPTLLYRKGRKAALKHFLEQPSIYHTDFFQKENEAQARRNIQREITLL